MLILLVYDVKKSLAQEYCVRREIFWNIKIRVERGFAPLTLTYFATWALVHCATCQESSYTKNEYNLFYQKLDGSIFFYSTKGSVLHQTLTSLFLNVLLFRGLKKKKKKSCNFLRKRQKTVSGAQVSFEEKVAFGDESEYTPFYGKWGFEYFFM